MTPKFLPPTQNFPLNSKLIHLTAHSTPVKTKLLTTYAPTSSSVIRILKDDNSIPSGQNLKVITDFFFPRPMSNPIANHPASTFRL